MATPRNQAAGLLAGGLALASLLLAGPVIAGDTVSLAVTGPAETVFDWSRDACAKSHVPDAPARAFRNADGEVRLVISHNDNRALVGQSLDTLRPDCKIIYEAKRSPRLADFDDLSWISGVYTIDGRTVYALAHTELRGERTPGQCAAGTYSACLLNTVTGLVSHDGGRSFAPERTKAVAASSSAPAQPMVATLPYSFPTDREARVGYSNPTNIIARDGYYYAFIFADGYRAQKRGNCLIRTRTLDDPASWRAWNGTDFAATFIDPFRSTPGEENAHVCAPVAPGVMGRMIGSIATHRQTGDDQGVVISVFGDKRRDKGGRIVEGIFTSTSRNLIDWSEPSLVHETQLLWDKSCSEPEATFYPALIDPKARTLSFEDVGSDAFLYLTRYQLKNCKVTWDRDLIRIPVSIQ